MTIHCDEKFIEGLRAFLRVMEHGRESAGRRGIALRKNKADRGSKLVIIEKMLTRPAGCTAPELLKAVDWPTISIQAQVAALGYPRSALKIDRSKRPFRYRLVGQS